jgi:hypothetical protein
MNFLISIFALALELLPARSDHVLDAIKIGITTTCIAFQSQRANKKTKVLVAVRA